MPKFEKEESDNINEVDLTPGFHKYILIEDNKGNHYVVSKDLAYHAMIYNTIKDKLQNDHRVLGGGYCDYDIQKGIVKLTQSSNSYGKANHDFVRDYIKSKAGSGLTIKSESDIQQEEIIDKQNTLSKIRSKFGPEVKELVDLLPVNKRYVFYETLGLQRLADKEEVKSVIRNNIISNMRCSSTVNSEVQLLEKYNLLDDEIAPEIFAKIPLKATYNLESVLNTMQKSPRISKEWIGQFIINRLDAVLHETTRNMSNADDYKKAVNVVQEHNKQAQGLDLDARINNYVVDTARKGVRLCGQLLGESTRREAIGTLTGHIDNMLAQAGISPDNIPEIVQKDICDILPRGYMDTECLNAWDNLAKHYNIPKNTIRNVVIGRIRSKIRNMHNEGGYLHNIELIKAMAEKYNIGNDVIGDMALTKIEEIYGSMLKDNSSSGDVVNRFSNVLCLDNVLVGKCFERAFAGYLESMKNNSVSAVCRSLQAIAHQKTLNEHQIQDAIHNMVNIASEEKLGHAADGLFYLRQTLDKKGINLDWKALLPDDIKERAFGCTTSPEDAYLFAKTFDMDTTSLQKAQDACIRYIGRSSLENVLHASDKYGFEAEGFKRTAKDMYDEYLKQNLSGSNSEDVYLNMAHLAHKAGLPRDDVLSAAGNAIKGFLTKGKINRALDIASYVDHPQKDCLKKVYDVVGDTVFCL